MDVCTGNLHYSDTAPVGGTWVRSFRASFMDNLIHLNRKRIWNSPGIVLLTQKQTKVGLRSMPYAVPGQVLLTAYQ